MSILAWNNTQAWNGPQTWNGYINDGPASIGRVTFATATTSRVRASSRPGARVAFNDPQRPRVTGG